MNEPVNNGGGTEQSGANQTSSPGAGSSQAFGGGTAPMQADPLQPRQTQLDQSAGTASQFGGSDAGAGGGPQPGGGQAGTNGGGRGNLGGSVNRLVGELRDKAMSAADQQKQGFASRLEGMAQAVHRSGEQLRGQQDWAAEAIERGADELQSIAGRLRNADARDLLAQLRGFADRQPAMFAAASLVAGLALGRLIKLAAAGGSGGNAPRAPEISYVGS
ncbi:hypothetical protein [Rhizorhabdus argentea]|uniref:hypothetical protein n=1 Tax=Rhizorhabdus argentea TaxID=1387174 RepID=UPI0030EB72EE